MSITTSIISLMCFKMTLVLYGMPVKRMNQQPSSLSPTAVNAEVVGGILPGPHSLCWQQSAFTHHLFIKLCTRLILRQSWGWQSSLSPFHSGRNWKREVQWAAIEWCDATMNVGKQRWYGPMGMAHPTGAWKSAVKKWWDLMWSLLFSEHQFPFTLASSLSGSPWAGGIRRRWRSTG